MDIDLLSGKVVFLTGGAAGIGRYCALAYARHGARVAVVDRDASAAQQTAADLGSNGFAIACDVSDGESVRRAVEACMNEYGAIHAVHNNAGISSPSKALDQTAEDEWDTLYRINVKSLYWTTRYALPPLRESHGSVLNTASMVGLIGQSMHAAYVSTKGAMIALTKAMALDYAPLGIRVNAICPSAAWTPMLREWASQQEQPGEISKYLDEIHPLGYCPEGDVVADAAVFLLSDKARFITGCILPVSGGAELGYRRVNSREATG